MVYFYSASINAFYADALKSSYGDNWPEDAQELSEIQVREFIENPRVDKCIMSDKDGNPSWVDMPPHSATDKARIEIKWRDGELDKVLNRIDQYQKDQSYPEEYRTSPITSHNDFLLLLADRKLLSDYPDVDDFPFGGRPTLSGLAQ